MESCVRDALLNREQREGLLLHRARAEALRPHRARPARPLARADAGQWQRPTGSQADSERTRSDQGRVETLLYPPAYASTSLRGLPVRPPDVAVYLADAQGQADCGKVHAVFGLRATSLVAALLPVADTLRLASDLVAPTHIPASWERDDRPRTFVPIDAFGRGGDDLNEQMGLDAETYGSPPGGSHAGTPSPRRRS